MKKIAKKIGGKKQNHFSQCASIRRSTFKRERERKEKEKEKEGKVVDK